MTVEKIGKSTGIRTYEFSCRVCKTVLRAKATDGVGFGPNDIMFKCPETYCGYLNWVEEDAYVRNADEQPPNDPSLDDFFQQKEKEDADRTPPTPQPCDS